MPNLSLEVNGRQVSADAPPHLLLVEFLREDLGLTGTHVGCDTGQCGACVVHLDGLSVKGCTILAPQAAGAKVTTIEGMANADGCSGPGRHSTSHHALQCGFCTPGMVMSAAALLAEPESVRGPDPPRCRAISAAAPAIMTSSGRAIAARPDAPVRRRLILPGERHDQQWHRRRVKRREDFRFLNGQGRYTDDINLRGQRMCLPALGSGAWQARRHRHLGRSAPGVMPSSPPPISPASGGLPCGWLITSRDGTPCTSPSIRCSPRARCAMSATRSRGRRRDRRRRSTRRASSSRYRGTAGAVDLKEAMPPAALLVHDEAPAQSLLRLGLRRKQGGGRCRHRRAAHVTTLELTNNRLVPNAMEPRAAIGDYDLGRDHYTLYTTSQNPHVIRLLMGAFVLQSPSTSCAWWRPTSAAASARKSITMPRKRR